MSSNDNYLELKPLSFASINDQIISAANDYLSLASMVEESVTVHNQTFQEKTYTVSSGEVICIYEKDGYVHHITVGHGEAYEMQIVSIDQTLNQNKFQVAMTLLEIYEWYHCHEQ